MLMLICIGYGRIKKVINMTYTKEDYERESEEEYEGLGACGHTGRETYCGVCLSALIEDCPDLASKVKKVV